MITSPSRIRGVPSLFEQACLPVHTLCLLRQIFINVFGFCLASELRSFPYTLGPICSKGVHIIPGDTYDTTEKVIACALVI